MKQSNERKRKVSKIFLMDDRYLLKKTAKFIIHRILKVA